MSATPDHVNTKNNRDETVSGNWTFQNAVTVNGEFNPLYVGVSLPPLNTVYDALMPVWDGAGGLLGYVKIYPPA
jgi:hypothetical protein